MRERSMAEIHYFPGSQVRVGRQNTVPKCAPEEQSAAISERYCIYNQTRERFVATNVEAVDSTTSALDERLRTLGSGGGTALWIVPFREISPSSVRLPIDLVFLTNDCVVLNTVESFPLTSASTWSAQCACILALPADSLAQGEILTGDQLVAAAPDEMKRYLQRFKESKSNTQEAAGSAFLKEAGVLLEEEAQPEQEGVTAAAESEPAPIVDSWDYVRPSQATPPAIVQPEIAQQLPEVGAPAAAPSSPPRQWKKPPQKNWFVKLLVGDDNADPRGTARKAVSGLIAYYFTGGSPAETPVRDISPSGVFIVTNERWYLGTVVRMTLTDRHNPALVRSITVNAKVVRYGSDGVGLEFILAGDDRRHGKSFELVDQTNGVDQAQILQFLVGLRTQ
jgi:hypothetical protein